MDEASSRFVDQLALERLLADKLSKVSHRPQDSLDRLLALGVPKPQISDGPIEVRPGPDPSTVSIRTVGESQYAENEWYRIVARPVPEPKGAILLVHGLFESNRGLYDFLIGELGRLGYSVYQTTLPFHYERMPKTSVFSGEYFFSADLGRTRDCYFQACRELMETVGWLESEIDVPVYVVGFSMGATVALGAAAASDRLRGVCLVNPAAGLSRVFWTSPLCQTIRADLVAAGFCENDVTRFVSSFDPFAAERVTMDRQRILMIYALFDQVTRPEQYEALIARWQLPEVRRYRAGHLNTLRVPRLAADITRFFGRIAASEAKE